MKMPRYSFHLQNGFEEDHALDLADDSAAVEEALKTASGMLQELRLSDVGTTVSLLEVRNGAGATVVRIEINATRGR
jgi:hypothetical protein